MAIAIPGRLPPVVPDNLPKPLVVDGKVIPVGVGSSSVRSLTRKILFADCNKTIVSLSAYTMNYSEELWGPDVREFRPERWLVKPCTLQHYSFSRGRRQCLGQK